MSGCPHCNHASEAAPAVPVMEMLRSSTTELHAAAEGHAFQSSLIKGTLPRELFARYLGQLFLVHTALERALERAAPGSPAIASVFKPHHRHSIRLAEDLRAYGLDAESQTPTPATAALIAEIERAAAAEPTALLGHFYVLEGSMNGNSFIARVVSKAYQIAPGAPGLKYLDPYGAQQRPTWQAFKDAMNACAFNERQQRTIVAAAQTMFRGISGISADMLEPAHA